VQTVAAAPEPGTVWVDAAVLDALQLKLGDPLLLGDATLKIARIIVIEPDRGAGFMSFAPRVMLHEADLAATGLVQPASRVNYRLAVAAPEGARGGRARVRALGRGASRPRRCAACAWSRWKVAGRRCADAGPRREVPQPGGAAGGAAGGGGGGHRGARLRAAPPRRLRDAARAGPVAAAHRRRLHAGVRLRRPARQRAGVAIGFAVHHVFVWLLAGLVRRQPAGAGPWPALFGWASA
jgi:putative ABC transport system permease protein